MENKNKFLNTESPFLNTEDTQYPSSSSALPCTNEAVRLHRDISKSPAYAGLDPSLFCAPSFTEKAFGVQVSSVPTRGRGMLTRTVITSDCICNRPRMKIICQVCGFLTDGRVRTQCSSHKNTIFLMDMEACARCKAISNFLRELPMCLTDNNNNSLK